jgi:hypothetical protein
MPDEDPDYARRGGRLLPVLFWAGVGLAPLAGLLLLLGGGGSLRVGAFLGVLALVLVGLSIALRPDATAVRLQLEETLLEELDLLRAEVREEIANASRATHQMVGERLGVMQQQLESLRGERARWAAPRSVAPAPGPAPGLAPGPPPAAAAHPVGSRPVPPAAARPVVAAHPVGPPVGQPMSVPPRSGRRSAAPESVPTAGNGRSGNGRRRGARHQADRHREAPPAGAPAGGRVPSGGGWDGFAADRHRDVPTGRAAAPAPTGGVYRHTETVQVTTRSTYVDEHSPGSGPRYDGGYGSRDWSAVPPRSRPAEPYEESWTDQKLRERYGPGPGSHDRGDLDASGEQPWRRDSPPWQPISAEPVSGDGDGDRGNRRHRWEGDDSGAELRLGERRAARHSDRNGTEVRLEERWASVRRDDRRAGHRRAGTGGPDRPAPPGSDPRDLAGRSGDTGYDLPDYRRPALPAASSEPSWNDWDEPVQESRSHRYRPDFELSDERWR